MKSFVKYSLLTLTMTMLGIALFEGFFRILRLDFNLSPYWKYHPVLGWTQVPNAVFDLELSGEKVHVEFNSLGFRDSNHALVKPVGTKRIVVLGDSFCEAVQVNLEQTFFRRLQNILNRDSDPASLKWEAINLGVGDFGNAQALIALEKYGLAFSPDVVLLEVFPLNDICNNSIGLFGLCHSPNDPYRPYYVELHGALALTSAQPWRNLLRRHVVSYGVLERSYLTFTHKSYDAKERERRVKELGYVQDPLLTTFADEQDQPQAVAQGWRITELILQQIKARCHASGIAFIPIVVPFEAQIGGNWEYFLSDKPPPKSRSDYPEQRLRHFFDRLEIPSIILKDVFDRNIDKFFPMRGGHFNPEAHRLTAEAIYEKMRQIGLAR